MLVPGAAVGAVGVPVKLGDAIVARNAIAAVLLAMSAIFVVILAVLDVTLVSSVAILFALVVILAVFAVILAVFAAIFVAFVIIFVLFVAMSAIFDVILAVFDAIFDSLVVTLVGKVVIVDELTPPTLLIVVGNVPVPLPETSPVKVIN